ncbi:S-layer homology domain-containing protein [Sporosarcina jeotgali]|uniref:S-layer homology domain-containing protein n=1 Tax=Sporosarcina jeotgali TaxID=3020056 RepID=A0ABZ0KWB0_9BACL|nr:S-layer homology domain-containing protein [Sporosarcina sp. B2O-1]WOV83637.1 S-layer homology domain-containing protein [Sporosarcina sp. B2O-1]
MNRFMKKFGFIFVLALLLQLTAFPLQFQAAETDAGGPTWVKPVNYLALGDSLAYGISSEGMPGKGYPDFLAQSLDDMKMLSASNKGFAYPGFTATDVLKDLNDNVTKPSAGIHQSGQNIALHQAIQDSTLITISVGANDMLKHIKIDPATGVPQFDMAQITSAIQQVGMEYNQILKAIHEINPNVQVYVMGYYNPFPTLAADYQPQLAQLLAGLNGSIQAGMQGTSAVFVPTSEQIAKDYKRYLPNPANIHLSEAGYKVIADEFGTQLKATYSWVPKDALTAKLKGDGTAALTWKPATDTKKIMGYGIYMNEELIGQVGADVLTYDVPNLKANTDYQFKVVAVNEDKVASADKPTAKVTTKATETPGPILFKDIQNHWAKSYIEKAVDAGIVSGYSDGTFKPDQTLTRVQATSIIVRTLGLKPTTPAPFKDISHFSEQIQSEVAAASQFGIVYGVNGELKPNDPVTRVQLAAMLNRTYTLVKGKPYVAKAPAPYKDISGYSTEAQNSIAMLHEFGIVHGSNGKFLPGDGTTRGQAAKILVSYSKYLQ